MFFADEGSFLLRQDFRIIIINPHQRGNSLRGTFTVPCHHDDLVDAKIVKSSDDIGSLRFQGIFDQDHGGKAAVNGHVQVRILIRQGIKPCLLLIGDLHAFVFKDKMIAPDTDLFPVYAAGDSMRHDIFHSGMTFFVLQIPADRLLHHSVCDGVGIMLLQACGQP